MTEKISQKRLARLKELEQQIEDLEQARIERAEKREQEYELSDAYLDGELTGWTENDWNCACDDEQDMYHTERQQKIIHARWAALFLVATHIARRGKILHADTAIKKLQQYGNDGEKIIDMINTPVVRQIANSEPFLSHALYKYYDITLLDSNLYNYLGNLTTTADGKRLQKSYALLNKFHKKFVLQMMQQRYKEETRPF
ncbi:MAG: hypothetical protein J6Y07_02155 [Alphaproteobacteria bacterium]|nr:hypothetical protein [Alphaproteobacteria bacterium]